MPFTWRVNRRGYCWVGIPCSDADILTAQFEDQGYREYTPLEDHTGLFLTFATTDTTERGILAFANRYGLLGIGSSYSGTHTDEWFSDWEWHISKMNACLERWKALRKNGAGDDRAVLFEVVNTQLHENCQSGIRR